MKVYFKKYEIFLTALVREKNFEFRIKMTNVKSNKLSAQSNF